MARILQEIKYVWASFRLELHRWSVYRLRLIVWIISSIIEPVVWSVLWYVTSEKSGDLIMSGAEILSYYLFITLMKRVVRSWTFDVLRKQILSGSYTKFLIWPKSVVGYRFGADWANRIISVSALIPFWLGWMMVLINRGLLVVDMSNFMLFILAVLWATLLRFLFDMFLAHLTLYFENIEGIAQVYWAAFRVFGGTTVPLLLLPAWAFGITKVLPFRYVISFPVEIFQGLVGPEEIAQGFLISGIWMGVIVLGLSYIFKVGLRKYEAVGL